jgi:PAS domain S-box-containing protein
MTVPTILMLESNRSIAQDLSRRLSTLGYPLLPVVEREYEVLSAIQAGKPDLILLNLHFGGAHSGPKLAAHIRKVHDLPVVFIIHGQNTEPIDHTELVEDFGFIVAPFDNTFIHATLGQASRFHQKEKTIRESQNQLAAILKSIGDGIVTVNEQGLIQFISPIAGNFTGLFETHALGASLDSIVTIIDKATQRQISAVDLIRNRRNAGSLSRFEGVLRGPNGVLIPVDGSVEPLSDHLGHPNGAVIAFRSLSEIQNSLLQVKVQAARSDALLHIIERINSQLDIESMLASFLQESTLVLEADATAVFLVDGDDGLFRAVSTHTLNQRLSSYHENDFEVKPEVIETLFAQDQSVIYLPNIKQLTWLPYHAFFLKEDIRSLVLARLQHQNHNLGVLFILITGRDREYFPDDLQFIKGLADYASIALATARLVETLRASRSRLQMVTRRLVEVQEAERRAVARELHDQVGQVLTGLQFSLETGKRLSEGNSRAIFEDSQQLVTTLMKQIRELSLKLSPSMLDDMGLLRTLLWHFEQYKAQTGIQVHFSQSGLEKRFPSEIEITAFRIIQEALTNVARYAKVDRVEVAVNADDEVVRLQVKDLGRGFDPQKTIQRTTFGLTSMKERAFLMGGQLSIKTAPGIGTELLAVIPISRTLERRRYNRQSASGR